MSTLLYAMGEDAEDTLLSTNPSEEERGSYEQVIAKFDAFFQVRRNLIFERARFNKRHQTEGESVEQFITGLYSLAEQCDFGDLKEMMIRNRIVIGIRDKALSERLQLDTELTLDKAKCLVRQREAVQEHQGMLDVDTKKPESMVDSVKQQQKAWSHRSYSNPGRRDTQSRGKKQSGGTEKCTRCGRTQHSRRDCPTKEAVCHACKKRGHFQSQCFSRSSGSKNKSVAEVTVDSDDDTAFLGTITEGSELNCWKSKIIIEEREIPFKLDTGAEVTVVSQEVLELLGASDKLRKTSKRLCGPDQKQLHVIGDMQLTLEYKDRTTSQTVYVVQQLWQNLLEFPAIKELKMLSQVDEVETAIVDQYPELFVGLGTLKGDYKIMLKPDAVPAAVYSARNVPLPLKSKVQQELRRMEELGVIVRGPPHGALGW